MPADKKVRRDQLPQPEKKDKRSQSPEEFNEASNHRSIPLEDKKKKPKANFSARDLPIY